ncbi:hypothetical protein [Alicyclobacillus macrosporangiidus]|uniref:hypothetical protein n=1 Tax=Alicyclobacillus macrosporangiidus TaxID=392015 RepID=UPI00049736D8|nr:hypothetical protein [Alicyclobacillus macrosporangiidus]
MRKVGFAGFGKSFLAWNLAGAVEGSVIYADHRAPYRVWNRTVPVYERWANVETARLELVCIDHEESEVAPDIVVYGVTPDLGRIELALRAQRQSTRSVVLVLVGYEEAGVPWPFPPEFSPAIIVPWDMRQATSPLVGAPLTLRDPAWRLRFERLWEVIRNVDAV